MVVMTAASVASWVAVTAGGGSGWNPELALGIGGPLVSALATWWVVERTHASAPQRVTSVMIAGFFVKLLLFGAYVALAGALALRPRPFVTSFAVSFIALHVVEARYLRQLFATAPGPVTATLDAVKP
jgi:hypothetical protein